MKKSPPMTVNRRTFMAGMAGATTAAAAGPAAAPEAGLVRSGRAAPLHLGIIGCGKRGQQILSAAGLIQASQTRPYRIPGILEPPSLNLRLVGVCDIYEPHLQWGLEASGGLARSYKSHEDLLARADIEAVIIATPDHWHAPMVLAAAQAGKHVYVEKCFTHQVAETLEAVAAVKKAGIVFQLGHQGRSSYFFGRAAEMVERGLLGTITQVQTFSNRNTPNGAWQYAIPAEAGPHNIDWKRFLGAAPSRPFDAERFFRWRKYWDYGTGLAGDLFTHEWDVVDRVLGDIGLPATAVSSGGTYYWEENREVPDVLNIAYEYPERRMTLIYNATQASGRPQGQVYMGSDGWMDLTDGVVVFPDRDSRRHRERLDKGELSPDSPLASYRPEVLRRPGQRAPRGVLYDFTPEGHIMDATHRHVRNWVEAIRSGGRASCHEDIALREALTCHMGVMAYRWGCRVRWDPQSQTIVPDQNL